MRLIVGDADGATGDCVEAARAMTALHFTRGRSRLLTVDRTAARHPEPGAVAELREHVRLALEALQWEPT